MKEQLKQINFDVVGNGNCKRCDGEVISGCCKYCRGIDDDLEKEWNKLLNVLQDNMNSDMSIDLYTIDFMIKLLRVKNQNNIINSFIEKQQIHTKIEKFIGDLTVKFNDCESATEEEDAILSKLLKDGIYSTDLLNSIIRSPFLQKKLIKYETFEDVIKCFTKYFAIEIAKELHAVQDKYIVPGWGFCVIKNLGDDLGGLYSYRIRKLFINSNVVSDFYNGKNDSALVTIFHELVHFRQYIMIYENYCNSSLLNQIKEHVIRDIQIGDEGKMDNYYRDNYEYISFENEARAESWICFLRYLDILGLKPSTKIKEGINETINLELEKNKNNLRTFEDKGKISTNEIFELVIENYPKYLSKYPQLQLEYTVEDNKVRQKTLSELVDTLLNTNDEGAKNVILNRMKSLSSSMNEQKSAGVK